jgi:hypothetical protein
MAIGQTEELDGDIAAADVLAQCADSLAGLEPQAGLLLASHDLEFEPFLNAVMDVYPNLEMIGCTTIAPMSSVSEYVEGSTTLTLFASDVLDFTAGVGTNIRNDIAAAARTAVNDAVGKSNKNPAFVISTPTVEQMDPALVPEAIGEVLGSSIPVFGGGAMPELPMSVPWEGAAQFYQRKVLTNSLPVLVVSGPLRISVGVSHGWKPVGKTAVVTKSNDFTIHEIDGEPILDFYRHYLGAGVDQAATANPLAMLDEATGRYYLRAPLSYDQETGSASFFGSIPEGTTVRLAMTTTEDILGGTDTSIADAMDGFPKGSAPEGVLVVSCAVRNFLLGTRTKGEIERILAKVGPDLPVSGFYAFGEIAPLGAGTTPRFHNETCVTVLLGT